MTEVIVDKNKIDILANAIADKSGESLTMTLDEMVEAVDGIQTGGITPTGNIDITQAGVTDVTNYATATVPVAEQYVSVDSGYFTENNVLKWRVRGFAELDLSQGDKEGWVSEGMQYGDYDIEHYAIPANTTITPTTSSQTIGGANYMMQGAVTVAAMPSGSVSASATKGSVSNHTVSVTPTATVGTAGYLAAGSTSGTAVSVSAKGEGCGPPTGSAGTEWPTAPTRSAAKEPPTLRTMRAHPWRQAPRRHRRPRAA